MATKCLFVEDNEELRKEIAKELKRSSMISDVLEVANGEEAMAQFKMHKKNIGLVLLDLNYFESTNAKMYGTEVLASIRQTSDVLVVILTSDSNAHRKNETIKIGADDYLLKTMYGKPIEIRFALENHLERHGAPNARSSRIFKFEGWTLNAARRSLINPDGAEVTLTTREFDLLLVFTESPQEILSQDEILSQLGPSAPSGKEPGTAFAKILSRLRNKIDKGRSESFIRNIHGQGFVFTPSVSLILQN